MAPYHPLVAHKNDQEDDDSSHGSSKFPSDDDMTDYLSVFTGSPSPYGGMFTRSWDGSYGPEPTFPSTYPEGRPTRSPSFVTSTSSGSYPAYPETTDGSSPTPTPINEPSPSATKPDDGHGTAGWEHKAANRGALFAAAGVVPVVVLIIIGVAIFFCLRKRKQKKQIAATQARLQEMKSRGQPTVQAYLAPTPLSPLREPSYAAPPNHPPPASPASPPPVILGPISAGSSGNYMTGIDTSDIVSVRNERTGLGDPFADGNSLHDEPPPPYRPRSLAPLSRDSSMRAPPAASLQTPLMGDRDQPLRSPFDDPQDDDAVSDLSGPAVRRNQDNMSVVSDLSYQQDPVVGRRGV